MHALIINGSPRVKKYSNTDKILDKFTSGMSEAGSTCEQYEISDRSQWYTIRNRFYESDHILIAIPLYVECIPGLLIEFLETLEPDAASKKNPVLSFILQSGFAEGAQLRCGESYLEKLAPILGCGYGGTLVKGDNFGIRLLEGKSREKVVAPYKEMGRIYGRDGRFTDSACKDFTGPEESSLPARLLLGFMFRTFGRIGFNMIAKKWGCTRPLDDRPYKEMA